MRSREPHGDGAEDEEERRRRARRRALRRKQVDEVFGQTVPTVTEDEREPGWQHGFPAEHYRASRPPHHGQR